MGCINNFISPEALLASGDLEECNIIEFNRATYSRYVNVTGPDNNDCSNSFPKGMKKAQTLKSIAYNTNRHSRTKVRINNCVLTAWQLGLSLSKRTKSAAIEIALEGLPRDANGHVLLNQGIPYA